MDLYFWLYLLLLLFYSILDHQFYIINRDVHTYESNQNIKYLHSSNINFTHTL